jgi:hypothetical protein
VIGARDGAADPVDGFLLARLVFKGDVEGVPVAFDGLEALGWQSGERRCF